MNYTVEFLHFCGISKLKLFASIACLCAFKKTSQPFLNLSQFLRFLNLLSWASTNALHLDFSSVAFDFAYLKKPVIYYHENDDYHYEKGYYDYQTMGFGEIVYNSDELVSKVIKYMENDCIMKEEYVSRVDSFFKYHDKDNCKRVYDWLYNH